MMAFRRIGKPVHACNAAQVCAQTKQYLLYHFAIRHAMSSPHNIITLFSLYRFNQALRRCFRKTGTAGARTPGVAEGDLFEGRGLSGGAAIGCATPESVRAAKVASGREKDALDVAEIDRTGCDAARYARVAASYRAMRIACVAHGE